MKLAIGGDHAGFELKQHLIHYLHSLNHEILDLGVHTAEVPADYPDVAEVVAHAITEGRAERGLLVCGSGIGACIASNKVKGIYAAVCHDTYSAAQGVEHDNMNVLCLGARVIGIKTAETLVDAFLNAHFKDHEPRLTRRFHKVQALETK